MVWPFHDYNDIFGTSFIPDVSHYIADWSDWRPKYNTSSLTSAVILRCRFIIFSVLRYISPVSIIIPPNHPGVGPNVWQFRANYCFLARKKLVHLNSDWPTIQMRNAKTHDMERATSKDSNQSVHSRNPFQSRNNSNCFGTFAPEQILGCAISTFSGRMPLDRFSYNEIIGIIAHFALSLQCTCASHMYSRISVDQFRSDD